MTIYVNFFFHCEDFISVHSQHATRRLAELFARQGLKADFYLTGMVVERMLAEAPETIDVLKKTGMPISYHSDHHAPFPTIWQRVRDLDWDEAVEQALFQENGHLNPCTGELTAGPPNQMSLITETFGRPPVVSIGAAAAHAPLPIRYAHHQMGVPMASILVPISGLMILVGGLSVLLGYRARFGALLLTLFLVPVTFTMHAFWTFEDMAQAQNQMAHFMKNIALIGCCVLLMFYGAGPMSIDHHHRRHGSD